MEFKDYYEIIGVKRDATQDEIKRAYRKLARKYHPDVSKEADAEASFKELGEAYEVLKDPEKRMAYDQLGADWKSGQDFRPPPGWDQGFESHGSDFSNAEAEQFSDFFDSLFGHHGFSDRASHGSARQSHREFHAHGEDTYAKIMIDLEDAYHGAARTLTLKHTELGADNRPKLSQRTLNVKIPKGVRQGQHIRLAKQGSPGIGSGQAGDLYLEVGFNPHAFYHVEGRDVFLDLPVAPWEAALGASVTVPTPMGSVKMKIPENTSAGRKLRLKARGIPGKSPGDFYVVVQIALPPADSQAAKTAYRDLEKALPFNPRQHLGV